MSPVILVLLGILMVWMAQTESSKAIFETTTGERGPSSSGYVEIPLSRFLVGTAIVGLPLFVIDDESWKGAYIFMIVLGFLVFNSQGLYRFGIYLSGMGLKS